MILEVRGECVVGRDSLDILDAGTGGKNTGREGTRTGARERNTGREGARACWRNTGREEAKT